ncbi:MAG: hypothetical protein OEY28_12800, partial [Nitrospira sp.]|nr:hypothetical protein [Nitrospira sp.]
MQPVLKEAIGEIRTLAARGDFVGARRRLEAISDRAAGLDTETLSMLARQGRTLEVLESIDIVRRLLRDGNTAGALRASSHISASLSTDDYADLGVVGAALTLFGRANELARKVESGDRAPRTRDEYNAFVDYLGAELNQLGHESVDLPLQAVMDGKPPTGAASTLGDLLSRQPWRSGANVTVEPPTGAHPTSSHSASVPVVES